MPILFVCSALLLNNTLSSHDGFFTQIKGHYSNQLQKQFGTDNLYTEITLVVILIVYFLQENFLATYPFLVLRFHL